MSANVATTICSGVRIDTRDDLTRRTSMKKFVIAAALALMFVWTPEAQAYQDKLLKRQAALLKQ